MICLMTAFEFGSSGSASWLALNVIPGDKAQAPSEDTSAIAAMARLNVPKNVVMANPL
ncbi:hypothetical protein D3C75_1308070 [compost metagenome]